MKRYLVIILCLLGVIGLIQMAHGSGFIGGGTTSTSSSGGGTATVNSLALTIIDGDDALPSQPYVLETNIPLPWIDGHAVCAWTNNLGQVFFYDCIPNITNQVPVLDVVDFGASTTSLDNSAAFQAAINAAIAGPIKTVEIPGGTWYTRGTIRIINADSVSLVSRQQATIKMTNWVNDGFQLDVKRGSILGIGNSTNTLVQGITLEGYGISLSGDLSNQLSGAEVGYAGTNTGLKFISCKFLNLQGFGILGSLYIVNNGIVNKCWFEHIGDTNWGLSDGGGIAVGGNYNVWTENTFVDMIIGGVEYYNAAGLATNFGPTVRENIFIDCVKSAFSTSDGSLGSNIARIGLDISENQFIATSTHGLLGEGSGVGLTFAAAIGGKCNGNTFAFPTNAPPVALQFAVNYSGVEAIGNIIRTKRQGVTNDDLAPLRFDSNTTISEGVPSFLGTTNVLVNGGAYTNGAASYLFGAAVTVTQLTAQGSVTFNQGVRSINKIMVGTTTISGLSAPLIVTNVPGVTFSNTVASYFLGSCSAGQQGVTFTNMVQASPSDNGQILFFQKVDSSTNIFQIQGGYAKTGVTWYTNYFNSTTPLAYTRDLSNQWDWVMYRFINGAVKGTNLVEIGANVRPSVSTTNFPQAFLATITNITGKVMTVQASAYLVAGALGVDSAIQITNITTGDASPAASLGGVVAMDGTQGCYLAVSPSDIFLVTNWGNSVTKVEFKGRY